MNRADVLASDCIHLRCGHAYSKGYQHTNLNDDSGVVVIRCTVCGATWQWGCICVDTDSEGDMSNKDKAAQDVNRAAQAGQQPDLTQMMTLLIQQQAQTHALLQRLLPAVTQPALPAPDGPRLTDRALVSREVDEHCHRTQEAHGNVWRWIYRQWARTGRGKTHLDDIARDGHMAEFLAFVKRELPNKPPHRPDAPVKRQPAEHIPNEELAAAIQSAGVSPGEIARRAGLSIETVRKALNGKVPGIRTRRQIAAALGTVVDRLWLSDDEIAGKLAGKALAATEGP